MRGPGARSAAMKRNHLGCGYKCAQPMAIGSIWLVGVRAPIAVSAHWIARFAQHDKEHGHSPLIIRVGLQIGSPACSSIHHATSAREIPAVIGKLSTIFTRRVSPLLVSRV